LIFEYIFVYNRQSSYGHVYKYPHTLKRTCNRYNTHIETQLFLTLSSLFLIFFCNCCSVTCALVQDSKFFFTSFRVFMAANKAILYIKFFARNDARNAIRFVNAAFHTHFRKISDKKSSTTYGFTNKSGIYEARVK